MDREITKLCKLANLELYLELNVRLFFCFSIHIDEMNMTYDMKLWVLSYNNILLTRNCSALYKDLSITYGNDYKNFEYYSFQYFIFAYDTTKQSMLTL